MPFGINLHGNRSSQALDNTSQAQRASPTDSPALQPLSAEHNPYDLRNPPPQLYSQASTEVPQSFIPVTNLQEAEFRQYPDTPADVFPRSPSLRYPSTFLQPQLPAQPLQGDDPAISAGNDQHSGDLRKAYSVGPGSNLRGQPPAPEKKSRGRFFGLVKGSRADDQQTPSTQQLSLDSIGAVTRRISKRHKDPATEARTLGQTGSAEPLQLSTDWQQGQSLEYHLPSPDEAEEDSREIDPYSIQHRELEKAQNLDYEPLHQPQNQVGRGDQDLTLRVFDENQMRQTYQQQQSNFPPQQQQPQLSTPVSPSITQGTDYHQQLQQYQAHQTQQGDLNPSSLGFRSAQNPEVVSQLSHDSPTESIEEQRPPSMQTTGQSQSSISGYGTSAQDHPVRTTSIQGPRPLAPPSTMPQPPQAPAQSRKSVDTKPTMQGDNRGGPPPPAYSQQQFSGQNAGNAGGSGGQLQQMGGGSQSGNYRSAQLQREYGQQGTGDQGRSTPPLSDSKETEMDKLVAKYKKVKSLYFEKQGQVEQLQNTLANQRLSLSRTSLDDSQYATRFGRLDGAIKEIAFSIRKDWTTIPRWLTSFVNQDAQKVGTKEMTAVGRAFISRWIYDEIFQKCFHPGLDAGLSLELKRIEQNIRLMAPPATSKEEVDALDSKVLQWKLATIEGLGNRLSSPKCADEMSAFTQKAVSNLTAQLLNHLQSSAIQSIEGNATSIIEIAVFIASHLPLESRDISITYPLPGDPIVPSMKVEQALPPLQHLGADTSEADAPGDQADAADAAPDAETSKDGPAKLTKKQEKSKAALQASGSMNGKRQPTASEADPKEGARVRFAGFMGVEVRGRHSLFQAPVWAM